MKTPSVLAAAVALLAGDAAQTASLESTSATTTYHNVTVDGVGVFYREAGPKDAPTLVLLHGFPSSSREFDTLLPLLATRYHLIAPDSRLWSERRAAAIVLVYTFDHLAKTIGNFLDQLKIARCSFFLHDYGGPVGFRVMLARPERVQALIIQNANVYQEGLGAKWTGIAQYWADPKAHPEVFEAFVSRRRPKRVIRSARASRTLQSGHLDRRISPICQNPGSAKSRPRCSMTTAPTLLLTRRGRPGCANNRPPTLVAWGRNDPSFIAPGAEAFRRDLRTRKSICSMPAILRWMKRTTRPRRSCSRSWRNTQADQSVRVTRDRQPGKPGIVGVNNIGQQKHFADAKPFEFGVLVADIGRLATLPSRDSINMMQGIAMDFRLSFPDGRDQFELNRRDADFFSGFADQRFFQALARLDPSTDRIPVRWPNLLRR